jgi:uncharacterized protein
MQSLTFEIEGEEFIFDHRRVIYWPRLKILLAADLHWGKTAYLQKYGIAVTHKVLENDLFRLSQILKDYDVRSLVVLGDLIHHEEVLDQSIVSMISEFRHFHPCELILLKGNHDRYARFPEEWGVVEEKDLYLKGFYLCHDHHRSIGNFQFSGHIHPLFNIRAGNDLLRLPTFILDPKFCLLPAFSELTGGQSLRLKKGQRAVVILPESLEVFEK